MKDCIICNVPKPLTEFYKHREMADGHLNKCKECCKDQSKIRSAKLSVDPIWREKENARTRDKNVRLNYKDKYKPSPHKKRKQIGLYKSKYPEKYKAGIAISKFIRNKGMHLHHWSYNDLHLKDVIELPYKDHFKLHRYIIYDQSIKLYKRKDNLITLNTKQSHIDLLNEIA